MVQNPKFFSLRWLRETNSSFERRIRCINDDDGILEVRGRDPDEYRSLALTFLSRMCLSPENTRALSIRGCDSVLDEFPFEEVLEFLSNVYCVEIRYNLGYIRADCFMAFLETEASAADTWDPGTALPSVNMLIFDSVEFNLRNFNPLRSFLAHRKRRKAPISYLGLNYCRGIGVKRLSTLKGLVTSVCVVNDNVLDKYGGEMDIPESGYMVDED